MKKCWNCNGHGFLKSKNNTGVYIDVNCIICDGKGKTNVKRLLKKDIRGKMNLKVKIKKSLPADKTLVHYLEMKLIDFIFGGK